MTNSFHSIIALLIVLLSLTLVNSAQPFQQTSSNGYTVKIPIIETVKQNDYFDFNIHLFNSSDGTPICDNSTNQCILHLYDKNGNHINGFIMQHDPSTEHYVCNEWVSRLESTNFSIVGEYSFIVACNSTRWGGFTSAEFFVTRNGESITTAESILYMVGFVFLFLIFLICVYVSMAIPFKNSQEDSLYTPIKQYRIFKIAFIVFSYLMSMFLVGIGMQLSDYLDFNGVYSILRYIYQIQLALVYPIVIVSIVVGFIVFIHDWVYNNKLKKYMNGGNPFDQV